MTCPNGNESRIQISLDGMSETKSTTVSLDIYTSRSRNCRTIFPHKIVRPLGKYKMDEDKHFDNFLNDLIENDYDIEDFIGDNLKRANVKKCLNHAASYACEYCFNKAVHFKEPEKKNAAKKSLKKIRENLRKTGVKGIKTLEKELEKTEKEMKKVNRTRLVWPSSTFNGERRTKQKMLEIVEETERRGKLPRDDAKGVVGRSSLFRIPNFDIIRDAPTEYMHSSCLGVGKRLVELTFDVGEKRKRITKRKLTSTTEFNKLMKKIKVVYEFSRRIRDLDFSVMKAEEFRNIVFFFFQ